jgi:hypothetical protein
MRIVFDQLSPNDGAVTIYGADIHHRRVIYINGMNTSPFAHKQAAVALSDLVNAQVLGVYNRSDGFAGDLAQCADEYADLVVNALANASEKASAAALRIGSEAFSRAVPFPGQVKNSGAAAASVVDSVELPPVTDYLWNPATYALWNLLAHHVSHWPHAAISIVAHSQGNLITSSALFMHKYSRAVKGIGTPRPIHVYALASPSPVWPSISQLMVRTYTYSDDPITWLSLGRSYRGTVGFSGAGSFDLLAAHDVLGYLRNSRLSRDLRLELGNEWRCRSLQSRSPLCIALSCKRTIKADDHGVSIDSRVSSSCSLESTDP